VNWSDEHYVRVYTRDTVDWMALRWEARAVLVLLMRKLDRAGVLDLGRSGVRGIAGLIGMPVEVVEVGLVDLLADGCLVRNGDQLVMPNFQEAQEARQSDAQRKRDERGRRRARAMTGDPGDSDVTESDSESQNVTEGHTESHEVTLSLAEHSLAKEDVCPPEPVRPKPRHREEAESWAEWFARKSGRKFSATEPLTAQVKALIAAGHTQRQLRAVALYCIREWQGDPKMAKHLVPSTLLRPGKFQERLDLATHAGIYTAEVAQ
jgi:uncharacterized phage protein (TIGR02220 family)